MSIVVTTATTKVESFLPHLVTCAACGCRYVYERRYSGEGRASTVWTDDDKTRRMAEKRARKDLAEMESHADIHDAIPCPQCFSYRPYMFSQLGYARYDGMGCVCYLSTAIGFLTLLGAVGVAAFWSPTPVVVGVGAAGAVVWLAGWLLLQRMHGLVRRYDPNEEKPIADRKRVAAARAVLLDVYDARQAVRVAAEVTAGGGVGSLPVEWWLPPSVLDTGGILPFPLPGGQQSDVPVPAGTPDGSLLSVGSGKSSAGGLKVRVRAMRVHPDEQLQDDPSR